MFHPASFHSALSRILSYPTDIPRSAISFILPHTFCILPHTFSSLLAVSVAHSSLVPLPVSLIAHHHNFVINPAPSKRSETSQTGSSSNVFAILKFPFSSFPRYLFFIMSLHSLVSASCARMYAVSVGFVTALPIALAVPTADHGAFIMAFTILGAVSGHTLTCQFFSDMLSHTHIILSVHDVFLSSRYFLT